MRKILRWLGILLAVILVPAVLFVGANYTYLKKSLTFFQQDQVRNVEWFEPTLEIAAALDARNLSRNPSTGGSSATALEDSAERFSEAIAYAESINTSALLVWHKGSLILEHYAEGYDAASETQTNSTHKSVLGLLIGIAVAEGAIASIDDPVSRYLAQWIDEPLGEISIKHLLTMTSGLASEKALVPLFDNQLQLLHAQDISKAARSVSQQRPPGEVFDYANGNSQLLLEVLEAATGRSYQDYLGDKLWSKLAKYPARVWLDRDEGMAHGFCCLIARAEDWLRLGILVAQGGVWEGEQLVPSQWLTQASKPSQQNPNFGYLLWRGSPYQPMRTYAADSKFGARHSEPYLVDDLLFFDGFGGQRVYISPEQQLVIVRVGETRFDFDDSVLPNRVIEGLNPVAGSDPVVAMHDTVLKAAHAPALRVRFSYPKNSQGQHPLIVFSHGNYLSNDAYHALTDNWVKSGYVVAAPLHLDSGEREVVNSLQAKVGSDWIYAARALDLKAVIDQVDTVVKDIADFSGTVQTDRVVAAGHSLGALTAQMVGGATLEALGNSIHPMPEVLGDSRIVAVVALSSPGEIPGVLSKKAWQPLATPQFVVTGTKDVFEFFWTEHSAHFVAYEEAVAGNNYLLVADGMDHYMGNLLGRLDRPVEAQLEALDVVTQASLRFMQSYLAIESSAESVRQMQQYMQTLEHPAIARFEHR